MQAQPEKNRHRFKMPSAFTILFIIIIIIAVLSWFIPAGKYSTDSSGNLIANTYHTVKSNPQGLWDVVMSPVYGMVGDKNTDPLRPRWFHLRNGRRNGRLLPALDPGDDGLWL